MNNNTEGLYVIRTDNYTLCIQYIYYYSEETHEQPAESDLEIVDVELNGMNITDFYWNYIDDQLQDLLADYAHENR
jgi:hypothetical protein